MDSKDTLFCQKKTLNLGGKLFDLSTPLVMGILNITPDSFYDGGSYSSQKQALLRVEQMIDEGVDIIDLGACSTRPGSSEISEEEELKRLLPILKKIKAEFPQIPISIDTYRSEVVNKSFDLGIDMINDVSGGNMDKHMFETVSKLNLPYVLMHLKGKPKTMQQNPVYNDVWDEVVYYFSEKINKLHQMGVKDIILDPGFGFGKTLEHNYILLNKLDKFCMLNLPVLVGVSRKSMITNLLDINPQDALNGTSILNMMALERGASILRVHDIKEAVQAIKIYKFAQKNKA